MMVGMPTRRQGVPATFKNSKINKNNNHPNNISKKTDSIRSLQRAVKEQAKQSVVESSIGYANQIRASRSRAKDAALAVKKLKYDFKKLSSQILRSKTSTSAKEVAGKARREVLRLKRQKQDPNCDQEELQSAITHAQAMERAAKKKARHLQEEEMVKVTGGPCEGDEIDLEAETALAENEQEISEEEQMDALADVLGMDREEFRDMLAEMSEEELQEFTEEMDEMMESMLEMYDLSELLEEFSGVSEKEMDPADFEMLKKKHRNDEMKAIVKADADYLKDMFERLEKGKAGGVIPDAATGVSGAVQEISAYTAMMPQANPIEYTIDISM